MKSLPDHREGFFYPISPAMNLQPVLENDLVRLEPLHLNDFETLYAVASDPGIWEQHPNKDRFKKPVFELFFEGAINSGGAFKVIDVKRGAVIGSSRFYDFNPESKCILIGYSFLARENWGGTYNQAMKKLMINYAFQFVEHIQFHIGANNLRSQIAIQRLGAKKIGAFEVAYYGEQKNLNVVFQLDRANWQI